MDVSVIVVNWNTRELLRNCIRSICEQASNVQLEIIVIDNRSTDGSAEMVKEEFPWVILVENSLNRGFAAANNQGISLAKGRYILLLNSDTTVCDNAIEKTVQYADKHPEVAVVGCQVLESPDKIQMTCFRFPSLLNLSLQVSGLARVFKYNHFFGREDMLWWRRESEREVDVISGMFMLVRRKAIDEVGLMDEDYFLLFEDTDWCYRFARAGWEMLFWPGAKIIHVDGGDQSSRKTALRMFIQFRKSLLIYFKKHHGSLQCLVVRILLLVDAVFRVVVWTMLVMFKRLMGKDVPVERNNMKKYWWLFKFLVCGIEPISQV